MPRVVQYKKGSISYFVGDVADRVFILQSGLFSLSSKDIETGSVVAEPVRAGEFFGVKSALGRFPREETASVIEDSTVIVLTTSEFEANFGGNKDIMMKMLKVFSGQLRQIHRKIDTILEVAPKDQPSGMFAIAKSFYTGEQYRSCCDVCAKILRRFPNTPVSNEVVQLFKDSNQRFTMKKQLGMDKSDNAPISSTEKTVFDIPAFERFAKKYEPGQVIISEFEPGDTFYLIQQGAVQLLKSVNGGQKNLDILKAGEFFGEMAILDNSPRSATCVAKSNVKCLEFSKENFGTLIAGNPQIVLNLLKLFCKRIYDQKRRFRILVIKENHIRIADVFVLLHEMFPDATINKREYKFKVTVDDIAQWAGLSKEITREEIDKLVEKHKIDVYDDSIVVFNMVDMKRLVDAHVGNLSLR